MMKKFWTILLTGGAMLLGGSLHASAAEVLVYDEGNRLSDDEYRTCVTYLQEASDNTGMNIGLVLGTAVRSEYTIESLADSTYDEVFGKNTDGLLYYVDLSAVDSPYDYISTSGMGQFYYSDGAKEDRINAIFDDVTPYLYPIGSEDIVGAAQILALDVEYYYDLGIPEKYYLYDDVYEQYFYVKDGQMHASDTVPLSQLDLTEIIAGMLTTGFFGLFVGGIIALIVYLVVCHRYKFKVSLSPTAYVNRKTLTFNHQHDNFIRTYTTKTKIESSSGGGGGHRGGGGRSSGGHGGGGRHR